MICADVTSSALKSRNIPIEFQKISTPAEHSCYENVAPENSCWQRISEPLKPAGGSQTSKATPNILSIPFGTSNTAPGENDGEQEAMWQEASRAIVVLTVVLATAAALSDVSVVPECGGSSGRVPSAVVDAQLAERSQKRHLKVLFDRYGENGTISLAGLNRLLQSVGLDRIRSVAAQHHHHHHHHHDDEEDSHETHSETPIERQRRSVDDHTAADAASTLLGDAGLVSDGQMSLAGNHTQDENHQHDDHDHEHLECQNASSLLSSHGMRQEGGVSQSDLVLLCPALLHQIDAGACILHQGDDHHDHDHHDDHGESSKSITTAWLGGFLSITVISLLSLLGVVLMPLMNKVFFKYLLSFLVALAVGTLSGDAFLHLIPHSQAGHQHSEHDAHDGEDLDGMWKGLTALGGVYFMFLIEHFLTLGKMYKERKKKEKKNKANLEKPLALKASEDVEHNGAGLFVERPNEDGVAEEEQVMLKKSSTEVEVARGYSAEDCENKCHSHFHDTVGQADSLHHHHHDYHHILHHHHSQNHHPHSHTHSYPQHHFQQAGVATLAWMVIMGDGLHNFSDGLAIGAAFSEGLSSGLSTSVAVFCHELPHELGDFAVLLKAGMTVRQAVLYNMLSATTAYLGMVTGILIGHYADNICMWIFALTAGLFMYVALVDMMPEMLHNDGGEGGFSHCGYFLLQNAGILLGFGIMLIIAVLEHRIQLDFHF
ncbi:zinc transporter ZIP6 isoform X2 [Hippocampus zosterae]|uniref:zinc transporter ZIP6 isoform X2 n=1 Tax=Hippocampus zosterae TaxID=109293 RepID=UPI00223CCEB7|nr:zinc transporter ZIP6 isoform X2 [Hippocampus zosterae]